MNRADRPALLVLASTYPRWPGDPEPGFVHELARRLTSRFDVTVLCPHARGAAAEESMDGVHVRRFRYAPENMETLVNDGGIVTNIRRRPARLLLLPGFAIGMMWEVLREHARRAPDVVHAHWLIPQGLLYLVASIGRRRRLLVTSHGADLFALRGPLFKFLRRFVASRASVVTVVSPAMKQRLVEERVPEAKVIVASMGVDFQHRFTPDLAIERSGSELLFVGRLVEKKGLRILLDALPMVVRACPEVSLTIAGFGPEEPALRQQAEKLGIASRTHFVGGLGQQELPALYRRAALFVAPFVVAASGDQEGLGLVALEASGCGCPVVISDLPAVREAFEDRVEPGSPHALAQAIIEQLTSTTQARRNRAEKQRSRLASSYDWSSVAATYSRLLESMLLPGASSP